MNEPERYVPEPVLSQEMLSEVQRLAYLLMSISEIAIWVEVEQHYALSWMEDRFHPFFLAVQRGRMQLEIEMREKLIPLAQLGEPSALIFVEKMIEKQKILDS
ncbi:MAG: hypothetical protein ABIN80_23010 [Dyadobacter sp.]|uniref:hypothetical protein n=1 Tax=Dyadobacter sp. TaxID=1914288 RepID=UPI0032635E7F